MGDDVGPKVDGAVNLIFLLAQIICLFIMMDIPNAKTTMALNSGDAGCRIALINADLHFTRYGSSVNNKPTDPTVWSHNDCTGISCEYKYADAAGVVLQVSTRFTCDGGKEPTRTGDDWSLYGCITEYVVTGGVICGQTATSDAPIIFEEFTANLGMLMVFCAFTYALVATFCQVGQVAGDSLEALVTDTPLAPAVQGLQGSSDSKVLDFFLQQIKSLIIGAVTNPFALPFTALSCPMIEDVVEGVYGSGVSSAVASMSVISLFCLGGAAWKRSSNAGLASGLQTVAGVMYIVCFVLVAINGNAISVSETAEGYQEKYVTHYVVYPQVLTLVLITPDQV